MGSNLFISFSLEQPKQTRDEVIDAIHELGDWAKVDDCVWYVHSSFTANQACARLWAIMNANDKLVVIDVTNNDIAWQGVYSDVGQFMRDHWHRHGTRTKSKSSLLSD